MDFKDKKVLVAGMARSGISATKLLLKLGAKVTIYDSRQDIKVDFLIEKGATPIFGQDPDPAGFDILVLSPGLPLTLPFIQKAYELGVKVISEIELGYLTMQGDLVAISGTNGKTTTTALTGQIFIDAGRNTYVLGNIGVPICEKSLETQPGDIIVAETAALQLDTIEQYRPKAGALLNITEDHLDRYITMDNYIAAKARLFKNLHNQDAAVLNYDDPIVRGIGEKLTNVYWFSTKTGLDRGAFLQNGRIIYKRGDSITDVCAAGDVKIPGQHNLENALAATCLASIMGVDPKSIAHTLKTFPGVEHRIEFVREVNGVQFINDSKGTNPDATIKAIAAMERPTVLILGGYDKHSDFEELFGSFTDNIKHIVLLGQTAPKIAKTARECGFTDIHMADGLEQATLKAFELCEKGWTVLLSPACASWDMFEDFEQRGRMFKKTVGAINKAPLEV